MRKKDTQSYTYLFTINNPLEKGYTHKVIIKLLKKKHDKNLIYICMSDEIGENGTFHTHVFVVFSSRVRFSTMKRTIPEAHIDQCMGTISENVNYVKKSGKWEHDDKHDTQIKGSYEEFGTQPPDSRGRNRDMQELYEMITGGMKNAEIIAYNQDYILNIDKIDKVRTTYLSSIYENDIRLDLQVYYIFGMTGTGKTRGVYEKHGYSNVYRVTDYDHPFDGYACQPVIFFDEFRSSLLLSEMLLYCDIYPVELPARYANKFACYHTVYIVSNWKLEDQYPNVQREDKESWDAFLRRIHKVIEYPDKDTDPIVYDSVDAYFNKFKRIKRETDVPEELRMHNEPQQITQCMKEGEHQNYEKQESDQEKYGI